MTDPLQWTQALSVNIPEIDTQHRSLYAIINDLHAEHEKGAAPERLLGIIGRLVDYSGEHFLTEENLMIDHDYPRFVQHNTAHLSYIRKMDRFILDFKANKKELSGEMLAFLTLWWKEHVSCADMDYARHIHQK